MSFGRFPRFEDDPFFSSPFPSFPSFPMLGFPALEDPHGRQRHHYRQPDRQLGLMDPFAMFNNMERMMNAAGSAQHSAGNGHYFSSSSVMHYSSNGGKEPQVYHATSSVTSGPGEMKETRKTESDSKSGMKKMAIGHHIGDRSHMIERRENARTEEREQHQQFINLDEDDGSNFDQEWKQRTSAFSLQGSNQHTRRRGISGVDTPHPTYRDHRSRSPEKRKHSHSHHLPTTHADSEAERRQEYLRQRAQRAHDKKVRF